MKDKTLVFTIQVKVKLSDLGDMQFESGLDVFRQYGSAEVVDCEIEEPGE